MLTTDRQIDRRILHEADVLESAGWKITILAPPKINNSLPDDKRVVRIEKLSCGKKFQAISLLSEWYGRVVRLIPLSIFAHPWIKKIGRLLIFDKESFYTKIFQNAASLYTPTVFVAHDLPTLPAAYQAASKCGARLVYDSHELYVEQELSRLEKYQWQKIEEKYIRACDLIITVNPFVAKELERRYNLENAVSVIYNSVHSSTKAKKSKLLHRVLGLSEKDRIVLFQGGLLPHRHLDKLIYAMTYVKKNHLHLVFLGDGPLKRYLQKLTLRLNLTSYVHFLRAVPQDILLSYTASADLGIIPYQATCLNNYYCTPNKLFEFLAAGIPILASDLPAIRAILSVYKTGTVADLSSSKYIALHLDRIFMDEQTFEKYAKNAAKIQNKTLFEPNKIINLFEKYKCV